MDDFWNEDNILKDLLFNTNLSHREIAKELEWTEAQLSLRVKELGLDWVRRKNTKLSRGHAALLSIFQKLFPNEKIVTEFALGERLRLDVYCPRLNFAAEYHGRQHFTYVEHFHGDIRGFQESQERDERKIQLCKEKGIALCSFRYNDDLSESTVVQRLIEAIDSLPEPALTNTRKPASKFKGNSYYESQKARNREWRRQQYRTMKQRQQTKK